LTREERLLVEAEPDIVGIGGGAQRLASDGEASNVAEVQELGALGHRVRGHVCQRPPAVRCLCHVQRVGSVETSVEG
jgi:hypothetical protein